MVTMMGIVLSGILLTGAHYLEDIRGQRGYQEPPFALVHSMKDDKNAIVFFRDFELFSQFQVIVGFLQTFLTLTGSSHGCRISRMEYFGPFTRTFYTKIIL